MSLQWKKWSFVPAMVLVAGSVAFAQDQPQSPAATDPQPKSEVGKRAENQQDRIAQGVKSGQLTAGETSRLEKQEAGINKEEAGMRAQDNGHLTKQDRKTLNQQQNAESKRIYRDKHNGRKA